MPHFTAEFADGTKLSRKSDRSYTHAWLARVGDQAESGFAASEKLADTAARAWVRARTGRADWNSCTSRSHKSLGQMKYRADTLREKGGKEAWDAAIKVLEAQAVVMVAKADRV